MNKITMFAAAVCVVCASTLAADAQPSTNLDLSATQGVIKEGKWKEIDFSTLTPVERCRVLMMLNDALDDIGGQVRAEADLMSQYIETQNLGPAFSQQPPPEDPAPLTYADVTKIAVAMLRGPLAKSSYATEFADTTDPQLLSCTEHLYQSGARSKWSSLAEGREQVRWMGAFLTNSKKMADYNAWVPGEVTRRQEEHRAAVIRNYNAEEAAAQAQKQQNQQQLAQQMQQGMAAAQSYAQPATPTQQPGYVQADAASGMYPAYGYAPYAGLVGATWYRDAAYRGVSAARVNARMCGWHGAVVRR